MKTNLQVMDLASVLARKVDVVFTDRHHKRTKTPLPTIANDQFRCLLQCIGQIVWAKSRIWLRLKRKRTRPKRCQTAQRPASVTPPASTGCSITPPPPAPFTPSSNTPKRRTTPWSPDRNSATENVCLTQLEFNEKLLSGN